VTPADFVGLKNNSAARLRSRRDADSIDMDRRTGIPIQTDLATIDSSSRAGMHLSGGI